MSRLSKPQNQQLTRNVDDKIKVVPTTKINKKWHNRTGTIISVHPTSGCYVVIIDEIQIVLFENEMELTD